MNEIWHT